MSELKMNGTITKISEVQEGKAKSGNNWKKLTFAIQTEGDYPKTVAFTAVSYTHLTLPTKRIV